MTAIELLNQLRELNFTLSADDGQLIVRGPKEGLPPAMRDQLAERKSEILELLKDSVGRRTVPLRRVARDRELCLSFAQQRLWFLDQLEPGKSIYNIPSALRLTGPLNTEALQRSLEEIVRRHEALRTTFATTEAGPVQVVSPSSQLTLLREEICCGTEEEAETEIHKLAAAEANKPFDLSLGPLFRATLIRIHEDDHVLLLTMHHIVSDGWSMGVLYRELAALYRAFLKNAASPLAELPLQYADFAVWQREWLKGSELDRQLAYWKKQLDGIPPLLNLPTDRPRPATQSFCGKTQSAVFGKDLAAALKAFNRREGVTLFITLLAAFQTLLYRYTGQEDIVVGAPIANRNRTEVEGLIGFFVNTLALRAKCAGDPTFKEFLASVRRSALEAYEHQDLPFEKLVEELNPHRTLSYAPVFQVMFVLQNAPDSAVKLEGLSVSRVPGGSETAKFDLTLSVSETAEGLRASLQYNTDLFENATIARWLGHYETLLEAIACKCESRLSDLPILTETERRQILIDWNDTKAEYPRDKCIQQLFEAEVERRPDAVALVFEEQQLTYRELNRRANQVAHYLRKRGVGPESLIGLCLERSIEMVIGILGILKAGGAYVPLEPTYPRARLEFMLADIRAGIVLTNNSSIAFLPQTNAQVICLNRDRELFEKEPTGNPTNNNSDEHAIYVIYTSGSTGKPKGVVNVHAGLRNRLLWMQKTYRLTAEDRVLQKTAFTFDVSVWEFLWPLISGACLVVARPEGHRDREYLIRLIQSACITTVHFVPSMLSVFLQEAGTESCTTLKQVFCSGETLSVELQRRFFECSRASLHNLYGPTEASIDVTAWQCRRSGNEDIVPIGRPIANTQIYILDQSLAPLPVGVAGDLYIGGIGLAQGYLNRPELTAEKFIANPFSESPSSRLYKTGDRARYLPSGDIEFLGRIDDQVKIRGFRIEPGEIEAALGGHPQVRECVVLARENAVGQKSLVAYVASDRQHRLTSGHLREFLKEKLPDHMVPVAFVLLDSLPLTPSGKIDRRALPAPDGKRPELAEVYTAPRTPLERSVAEIWMEVLKVDGVGIHDNFFELGGHSLLATQVVSRIRKMLLVDLPVRTLFATPTIADLCAHIEVLRCEKDETQRAFRSISEQGEEIIL